MPGISKTVAAETPAGPLDGTELTRIVQSGASKRTTLGEIAALYRTPLTTKGDLLGYDTSINRIPVGPDGDYALIPDSTQMLGLKWDGPFTRVSTLADTSSGSNGAGLVGFAYSLTYTAGTIGAWLKNLATSVGGSFIKTIATGTGAVARTIEDILRDFGLSKNFGVDMTGAVDSTTALSNFITAGGGDLRPFGSIVKTTSSLSLDVSLAQLQAKRLTWNATGIMGAALNVFSSQAYPLNDRLNGTSVIEGIAFVGNNTAGSIAVQIGSATYTNNNEITFRNCSFSNFETLVKFIANSWRVYFENCKFFNCNSTGSGFFINFPSGISANAGEVMTFTNCTFYDPLTAGTDLYLYSGQWVFDKCSFGGGITRIHAVSNAVVTINGCNMELQNTSASGFRMLYAQGTSTVNINGGTIVMNGGGTTWTYAPLQIDDTAVCNISGLTCPNPNAQMTFSADTQKNLVQGTSPYISARGVNMLPSVNMMLNVGLSSALSVLYNGDASQTGTNGWTGTGLTNNAGTGPALVSVTAAVSVLPERSTLNERFTIVGGIESSAAKVA